MAGAIHRIDIHVTCNARMSARLLRKYCVLDAESMEFLKQTVANLNLTARACSANRG
jgi:predicted ATPase with chaperone activity